MRTRTLVWLGCVASLLLVGCGDGAPTSVSPAGVTPSASSDSAPAGLPPVPSTQTPVSPTAAGGAVNSGAGGQATTLDLPSAGGAAPSSDSVAGLGGNADSAQTSTPDANPDPRCVISADCRAGQYCDLGLCVQACNDEAPCGAGLDCSPRGRCVPSNAADQDPPAPTTGKGTFTLSPERIRLTDQDTQLELKLVSTSAKPVRYRVELNAPYLELSELQGTFTKTTTLVLKVNGAKYIGQDASGAVRVITDLGSAVSSTQLHGGITGRYHGSLRYDQGAVALGDARLSVEIFEKPNGDLSAQVIPEVSLLFPAGSEGPVSGFGSHLPGLPIDLNLDQLISKDEGGDQNHFQRPIGRHLQFTLRGAESGRLDGDFTEVVYGLFASPVLVTGHVHLEHQPGVVVEDMAPISLEMPSSGGSVEFRDPGEIFGMGLSTPLQCLEIAPKLSLNSNYGSLLQAVAKGDRTYSDLRSECELSLKSPRNNGYVCGCVTNMACQLKWVAGKDPTDQGAADFGGLLQGILAPANLVAQDYLVESLRKSSMGGSLAAERMAYDKALSALAPVSTLFLQEPTLEYLRQLSGHQAELPPTVPDGGSANKDTFPAARALASLLRTQAEVQAERSRVIALSQPLTHSVPDLVDATDSDSKQDTEHLKEARDAQSRALMGYLEAVALTSVFDSWGVTPKTAGSNFSGVLSTYDQGFAALLDGAAVLGVKEGFVPFVYRDTNTVKGGTNFEQEMANVVDELGNLTSHESRFQSQYDGLRNTAYTQESTMVDATAQYGSAIAAICGNEFDQSNLASTSAWKTCGLVHGTLQEARQRVVDAEARLKVSQSRVQSMRDKVAVARKTLTDTQSVHSDTLYFVQDNGNKISENIFIKGGLQTLQDSLAVAAESNLWNAGLPGLMSAAVFGVGMAKTSLDVQNKNLETAQTMRFEEQGKQIELIQGMSSIKLQLIDIQQLIVEMQLDVLAISQANLQAANLLEQAQALATNLARAKQLANQNPGNDPAFRMVLTSEALAYLHARARTQRELYLAGKALAFEINTPLGALASAAANARSSTKAADLANCLKSIFASSISAQGASNEGVVTVSVRKLFGITALRTDSVTGQVLSQGEQFRKLVLRSENLDPDGSLAIKFSTNLDPGNGIWSKTLCNDHLTGVQAQLVGDFQGDNDAEIDLAVSGAAVMRECASNTLLSWPIGKATAVVHSGVNSFGESPFNISLFGQSVARASWELRIPAGTVAPANSDLDLSKLDDIVLKLKHRGSPVGFSDSVISLDCLSQ